MKTINEEINNCILALVDHKHKLYFFRVENINEPHKHSKEAYQDYAFKRYLSGKVKQNLHYHENVCLHLVATRDTMEQHIIEQNLDSDIKVARAQTKKRRREMGKLLQALGYKNMGTAPLPNNIIKAA